jgi:hypothetical protein
MLSSFSTHKGGDKNKRKGDQQGNADTTTRGTFVPAKFHGGLTDKDHVLVEGLKTFEIPFGTPVEPIFEHIRLNQYTKIEPILKGGYDLNKKLFEGGYIAGPVALYWGDSRAAKNLRTNLETRFTAVNRVNDARAIKDTKLPKFTEICKTQIDDVIEDLYGERFNENHQDKANAIMSLFAINANLRTLLINISNQIIRPAQQQGQQPRQQQGQQQGQQQAQQQPAQQQAQQPRQQQRQRGRRGRRGRRGGGDEEYNTVFDDTTLSTFFDASQYGINTSNEKTPGLVTGGRYTGETYPTFYPMNTSEVVNQPAWYEISPKSMNNLTPLQYAIGYGSVDSVRVLIRNGSDFTVSTLDGVSLLDLARSRKSNDFRSESVKTLIKLVLDAYGAAYSDYNSKKMKEDYVNEANISNGKSEQDILNFVYTKTYKALKKGKSTGEVLGEVGDTAKKQGRQDALDGKPEDKTQSESDNKEVRDGYLLGVEIGKAELAGKVDGSKGVKNPRNKFTSSSNSEVREAYLNAFTKEEGASILKGFKDGILGKEKVPPTGIGFLKFDKDFAKSLQFGDIDQNAIDDYEKGYTIGNQKFVNKLKDMIDSAEKDGTIDGRDGKPKYTRKYLIKSKPLLGAVKVPNSNPPQYTDEQYGKEETFEVDYGDLDTSLKTAVDPSIPLDPSISIVPDAQNNITYTAYIQASYNKGYNEGASKKGGNTTYKRKRHGKNRTYKKKLSTK